MIDLDDNRFAVSKSIDAKQMITHRIPLDKLLCAYDTFDKAADTKALKVLINTGAV